jgi:hypothetical protein
VLHYLIKLVISAALIVLVSEVAKRSSLLGGLIASLPLVSYLGIIWLYAETGDVGKVSALAADIFWLVLPSLALFAALPWLLKRMSFTPALSIATVLMFTAYGATVSLLAAIRTDAP